MPVAFAARDDLLDLVGAADVAGVDPHRRDALLDRLQGQARVEVDVRDDRHRRKADDLPERFGVLGLRNGDADDLAAGARQRGDLRGRRGDVVRLRRRHRLDDRRRAAPDLDAADGYRAFAGHGFRVPGGPGIERFRSGGALRLGARAGSELEDRQLAFRRLAVAQHLEDCDVERRSLRSRPCAPRR